MLKLADVEGNDVAQAILYYRQCVAAGTWTPQKAHTLLHKQDNPDQLIAAIAAESGSGDQGTDVLPPGALGP